MRTLVATAIALGASAAIVAAQTQTTSQSQSSQSKYTQDQQVTYTGCLQLGTTAGTYLLANATENPGRDTSTGSTSVTGTGQSGSQTGASVGGTVTSSASTPRGLAFKLVPGSSDINLADNLNHQIQVTGTIETWNAATGTTGSTGTVGATGTTGTTGTTSVTGQSTIGSTQLNEANLRTFTVKDVKSISDRCSAF